MKLAEPLLPPAIWAATPSAAQALIVALILVGIWVIVFRVPTRERVLEARSRG